MLDAVSLDQLRTFIAAADEGSFSAAGRKLRRAQSVVSHTLANLEGRIEVQLFDRSGRYPRLTEQGAALLAQARLVVGGMDGFKSRARAIADGLEPELSVVVDVMYPMASLTDAVGDRRTQNQPGTIDEYPNWRVPLSGPDQRPLRLEDVMSSERAAAVAAAVTEGR